MQRLASERTHRDDQRHEQRGNTTTAATADTSDHRPWIPARDRATSPRNVANALTTAGTRHRITTESSTAWPVGSATERSRRSALDRPLNANKSFAGCKGKDQTWSLSARPRSPYASAFAKASAAPARAVVKQHSCAAAASPAWDGGHIRSLPCSPLVLSAAGRGGHFVRRPPSAELLVLDRRLADEGGIVGCLHAQRGHARARGLLRG